MNAAHESASALSLEQVAAALAPFRIALTEEQLTAVRKYTELLVAWNGTMNLTALEDPLEIVAKHFGESMLAATVTDVREGRLADVGSGAGFPGLALKIASPHLAVSLVETNLKKCAFLTEVTRFLGLSGVQIVRNRYQDWIPAPEPLDFVCSRALGDYKSLLRWAENVISESGRAILWIGRDDSLLIGRAERWLWDVPIPIPESQRRVIMVGRRRL